jgi:phage FluMu protein Com
MAHDLTECFELDERRPSEEPTVCASGTWFCPACGVRMVTKEGVEVRCPRCERTLNEFVYALTELHPHA